MGAGDDDDIGVPVAWGLELQICGFEAVIIRWVFRWGLSECANSKPQLVQIFTRLALRKLMKQFVLKRKDSICVVNKFHDCQPFEMTLENRYFPKPDCGC